MVELSYPCYPATLGQKDEPDRRATGNRPQLLGKRVEQKNKKSAILLLTHLNISPVFDEYSEISSAVPPNTHVFVLGDNTKGHFEKYRDDSRVVLFTRDSLAELPYPGKASPGTLESSQEADPHHRTFNFDPGNVDLPILLFFRRFPNYAHYWVVEHDVRYSGGWSDFFKSHAASEADLLGTTLCRRDRNEDWHYWPSLDLGDRRIARHDQIRGFFPIYRLSRRALERLDADYRSGVGGHFECLIPTLLNDAGMSLEDIGGAGEFVRPANKDRFYRNTPSADSLGPGTFVFRPVMERPGREPNMLWHPVRPQTGWRTTPMRGNTMLRRLAGHVAARMRDPFRGAR